jgi:hypothetical protein
MGHFHIQWKRNKKNQKTIQGPANKNSIQNSGHNTKYSETASTNRQIQQNWRLPTNMLRLPTKTQRTNRQTIPHQI